MHPGRRDKEVHVIAHQAIRVQPTSCRREQLGKPLEVHRMIHVLPEARLSVVAPLHDVQRDVWNDEACLSRHIGKTLRATAWLTELGLRPQISSGSVP